MSRAAESPPRVLLDLTVPYRAVTGQATYTFGALRELRRRTDVEMQTIAASRRAIPSRSRWQSAARSAREALWTQSALPLHAVWRRADLIHSPAYVSPLLAPKPVVLTMYDTFYLRYPEQYPKLWLKYFIAVAAVGARRAAAIVTTSLASKHDLTAAYGLPAERIHVIYPGPDAQFTRHADATTQAEVRARYGLTRPYIVHVGLLVDRKNVARLVEAYARLRAHGVTEYDLVLVGSSTPGMPGRDEILTTIHRHGLTSTVRVLGRIPMADVPVLYQMASVSATPSLAEGFGFPVLEAMTSGTPVACSNTSSLPEVADGAAELFDPLSIDDIAAALQRVLANAELRTRMAATGLRRAAEFQWSKTAEATVAVYREALARRHRA